MVAGGGASAARKAEVRPRTCGVLLQLGLQRGVVAQAGQEPRMKLTPEGPILSGDEQVGEHVLD